MSAESAGEVLSRTILKMGGKKQLGHKWQWRRAVILIEAKLRYWDAKTEVYRGEFSLEGAECAMITEKDEMYAKLSKLKKPKAPEGVSDIANPSFFSIKPRDSMKTYYFGVPASERALWIGYMNDARDGIARFREALRLKRGATASFSTSSSNVLGNLQPIGSGGGGPSSPNQVGGMRTDSNTSNVSSNSGGSSISSSATSQETGGSYTSLGPSSGRSFQSSQSIQSSNSGRSNTANSDDRTGRITTIESGTMPGANSLAHHSASAPPARNFNIVISPLGSPLTSLTPRPKPLDEDPFGLVVASSSPLPNEQYPSSPSPSPADSIANNQATTSATSTGEISHLGTSQTSLASSSSSINTNTTTASNSALGGLSLSAAELPINNILISSAELGADSLHMSNASTTSSNQSYTTANGGLVPSSSTSPAPLLMQQGTPSSSPSPLIGTTTLTAMPQPLLFDSSSVRDSFVFDSAI